MSSQAQTAPTRADVSSRGSKGKGDKKPQGRLLPILLFLAPAAVFIGALIIYPLVDTIAQSFQNEARQLIGFDNYVEVAENERIRTAIRNTFIWVVVAPGVVTGFGLIVAVVTERVSYSTAIKLILFMPFAISGLSAGVLWRITYEQEPERGVINAAAGAVVDAVNSPGRYPNASALADSGLAKEDGAFVASQEVSAGDTAELGLVGITDADMPPDAAQAAAPEAADNGVSLVVWRDFQPGGGRAGELEEGELGLPGMEVELVDSSGGVAASGTTSADGSVVLEPEGNGPYTVSLASSNFEAGFAGIDWLGPSLVTPALIAVFFWGTVGFAVVIISGGLSALPRDLLEAARVDGATEWQVFRHITAPLLRPVLGVVFVSLTINVLKMFDLVWVTAPGASADEANVIAVEMFRSAFAERNFGVGAAVAVILFVLVIPIMVINLRQFRRED